MGPARELKTKFPEFENNVSALMTLKSILAVVLPEEVTADRFIVEDGQ